MKNASYYIDKLNLTSHIEGGAFKETYRSDMMLPKSCLTDDFKGDRNASTAIYFLLKHGQFSALHKIAADEMWHFYDGNPLCIYEITEAGNLLIHKLGHDLEGGETFQCVIKAGSWFGSRCEFPEGFSLVGCTVAPGFDFHDFELAQRQYLISEFPKYEKIITKLTHE